MKVMVDKPLLDFFRTNNVFQARYNSQGRPIDYVNRFEVGEYITFKEDVIIEPYSTFASGHVLFSAGMFSEIASPLPIGSKVGRHTCIARGLKGFGFRHPIEAVGMSPAFFQFRRENVFSYFKDYEESYGTVEKKSVPIPQKQREAFEIGNDVWIGTGVTLNGGIKIGDGAVIAAGSVVTKDVRPYSVVAGVPAIHRKWRFSEDIIEKLIASSWWDYELGDMYKQGFDFSDPSKFLDQFNNSKEHIRKVDIKNVPLVQYSIFGDNYNNWSDKNILIDHENRVVCVENQSGVFKLVKIDPKKNMEHKSLPVLVKKYLDEWFLYVEKIGFIEINKDFSISFYKDPHEIKSTKIKFLQKKASVSIGVMDQYLASDKNEEYVFRSHVKVWETFKLPLYFTND